MVAAKGHYEVLGVAPNADAATIKTAYRALARRYHPDRNNNDPTCSAAMRAVNAAYEVLSDPKRRAHYDALRTNPQQPSQNTVHGAGFRVDLGEAREIVERTGNDLIDLAARRARSKAEELLSKAGPIGERTKKVLDEMTALGSEASQAKLAELLKKLSS